LSLIHIGTSIPGSHRGLVVALALPTRGYAAALLCLGAIVAGTGAASTDALRRRFERLRGAERGTPVVYLHKGRRLRGVLDGTAFVSGEVRVRIRIQNARGGNLTHLIRLNDSVAVMLSDERTAVLPRCQRGRPLSYDLRFASHLHPELASPIAWAESYAIVGSRSVLKQELVNTPLAFKTGKGFVVGKLQDVLRARDFSRKSEPSTVRIYHVGQKTQTGEPLLGAVYFDGARAYLENRAGFQDSPWIVVLDRAERAFEEAVAVLNQQYTQRKDCWTMPSLKALPVGLELMAFVRSES